MWESEGKVDAGAEGGSRAPRRWLQEFSPSWADECSWPWKTWSIKGRKAFCAQGLVLGRLAKGKRVEVEEKAGPSTANPLVESPLKQTW